MEVGEDSVSCGREGGREGGRESGRERDKQKQKHSIAIQYLASSAVASVATSGSVCIQWQEEQWGGEVAVCVK